MRAARSEFMFNPLPRFWKVDGGGGLRAALTGPSGVEEDVMLTVKAAEDERERGDRVGGARGASVEGDEAVLVGDFGGSEGSKGSVILTRVKGRNYIRCMRSPDVDNDILAMGDNDFPASARCDVLVLGIWVRGAGRRCGSLGGERLCEDRCSLFVLASHRGQLRSRGLSDKGSMLE
jgi:hypothetical protein